MGLLSDGTLLVGAYGAFAPFSWVDNGVLVGRDIAFLRHFATEQGLRVQVRLLAFDGLWAAPGRDLCDIAAAGIALLPSRTSVGVSWSRPYFTVQRAILIRATDHQLRTIADFSGRTIGVTKGSTAEHDVARRRPETTRVVYSANQDVALADLAAGRIDGYATGDASAYFLIECAPGRYAVTDLHASDPPEQLAFAVRTASGLTATLDAYIAANQHRY